MFYSKCKEIALWEKAVNCPVTNNALIKRNVHDMAWWVRFSCIVVHCCLFYAHHGCIYVIKNYIKTLWNI